MKATVATLMMFLCSLTEAEPLNIVGTSWPPYEMRENDKQSGMATEISFYIFDSLGIDVVQQLLPWKRALIQVENGTADAIISISESLERKAFLNYPETFLHTSKYVFFKRKNEAQKIVKLSDLRSYKVGVTIGYSYTQNLWQAVKKYQNYDAVLNDEMNLKKLALGRIDFFPCDLANCLYLLKKTGLQDDISYESFIITEKQYYLAFSKASDYPDLSNIAKKFNKALLDFKKTENYQKIERKYLK